MSKVNVGKVKSSSKIKDGNGRLALGGEEAKTSWKGYFEDLYNIDTQEHGAVHMCVFDCVSSGNYFGGKPIRRTEVEVRVGKF